MSNIHPNAMIEPGAVIGKNVTIEPFAIVKKNVILKDHVVIKSHAYIDGYTTIGEGTTIWPSAVIGSKTQDLKYRGEKTFVEIGKNCDIREFVTINSSCGENSAVQIGDNCLIMAYCHVAHNCVIGNRVIMSNGSTLAGHVIVEDHAIIGGITPVHQFSRIGKHAMVGGFSRISHDVPPFTIGGGAPYKLGGLNLVGLKRHEFPLSVRKLLSQAFRITYRSGNSLSQSIAIIEDIIEPIDEIKHWVSFCRNTQRGLIALEGVTNKPSQNVEEKCAH